MKDAMLLIIIPIFLFWGWMSIMVRFPSTYAFSGKRYSQTCIICRLLPDNTYKEEILDNHVCFAWLWNFNRRWRTGSSKSIGYLNYMCFNKLCFISDTLLKQINYNLGMPVSYLNSELVACPVKFNLLCNFWIGGLLWYYIAKWIFPYINVNFIVTNTVIS